MLFRSGLFCSLALSLSTLLAGQAQAQGSKPMSVSSSGGGSSKGGDYRAFTASMPIVHAGPDTIGRAELNLYGRVSLAVEGMYKGRGQDITAKDQKLTGESMITQGRAGSLFLTRYSEPMQMAGFYYSMGLGYRQETAQWRIKPDGSTVGVSLDDQHFANHDAVLSGPTGTLRGGYRYVGKDIPLLIGAYVGVRHFEATVKDEHDNGQTVGGVTYSNMTDAEKEHLKRRFATAPELALEIGFAL